jgi:ABC-type uncharacterized transport system permease subunit
MQRLAQVPVTVVYLLEGLVILFILSGEYFIQSRAEGHTTEGG